LEDREWGANKHLGEKWVPILTTFTIYSSPQLIDPKAKVYELIDKDKHD
jgi:hypothetical protein